MSKITFEEFFNTLAYGDGNSIFSMYDLFDEEDRDKLKIYIDEVLKDEKDIENYNFLYKQIGNIIVKEILGVI